MEKVISYNNKNVYLLDGTHELPLVKDGIYDYYFVPFHWYAYTGLYENDIEIHSCKYFFDILGDLVTKTNIIFMANSIEEYYNLLIFFSNYQVIFCSRHFNHGFLNSDYDRIFYPNGDTKEYDFIFNGGHNKFQEKLQYISNLCIVDKNYMKPNVPCKYYNNIKLSLPEVNNIVNKSKIGIVLTEIEGASWASMEFLLCGIPVISCVSKGGRDVYYNKNNSVIFDIPYTYASNHEYYCSKLKELCEDTLKNIHMFDANYIRSECIKTCNHHKDTFVTRVMNILCGQHNNILYNDIMERINKSNILCM